MNPTNAQTRHGLQRISSPAASAKQRSAGTDCSDDGWVGVDCGVTGQGGSHTSWQQQQTECTHSGARDKASTIMCGGTAVCVCVSFM